MSIPMPILIRAETPADTDVIEQLTAAAFQNAPHTSHTEQFIVHALRRAGQLSVSFVAQYDDEIVGHVAI
jgi:predicted N-acetyltransferase YhbS